MNDGGNAKQSAWSQEFHAARGDIGLPCPAPGGCGGNCKQIHPRGVVITAAGGWYAVPVVEYDYYPNAEHYA